MKKVFVGLVMLLSLSAANVFAQSSLIATLSHEGEITAFYGADALKEAHEAAAHGDAITLSSGTFSATDITKAITLRGAGMQVYTINNVLPTLINGDFTIQIAEGVSEKLTIEGICHLDRISSNCKLSGARFIKSRLGRVSLAYFANASFLHCKIIEYMYLEHSDCIFNNCYVADCRPTNSSSQFYNCILVDDGDGIGLKDLEYASLYNCILIGKESSSGDRLPSSCVVYNCTGVNCYDATCFKDVPIALNVEQSIFTDTFKDYTGIYSDDITFELTDKAKKWLGTDGTQQGIYGGNFPYDPTTSNPHITKCNVAAKSTADGKLSVDIEVAGVE